MRSVVLLCLWCASASGLAQPGDVTSGPDAPEASERRLPSISATHVRYVAAQEIELARALVWLSGDGLRVRQVGQGAGTWEVLESFSDKKAWLIDRDRRVVLSLNVDDSAAAPPPDASDVGAPGFLGTEPCGGTSLAPAKTGLWRNRPVRVHECAADADGIGAVELVDEEFGIVTYRRDSTGRVDELRNLRMRDFPVGTFVPGPDLRAVDASEFFDDRPEIGRYVEPGMTGGLVPDANGPGR